MGTQTKRPYNRSNLFLVRVWARNYQSENAASGRVEWSGKVQRVVDGESHQFTNLQELVDLLEVMILVNQNER